MSRDLGDVLHYFLPEAGPGGGHETGAAPCDPLPGEPEARDARRSGRPVLGIPLGEDDLLRGAFVWNLAVEMASQGAPTTLIASRHESAEGLWPVPGTPGTELVLSGAEDLSELAQTALDIGRARALGARRRGFGLVHLPRSWLDQAMAAHPLLAWTLLFTTPERHEQADTAELAARLLARFPAARVGVTVHGVSGLEEARDSFDAVAAETERRVGASPVSYGLLLDDLQVYRAITQRRPVSRSAPQSRAARALHDVARLLLEDDARDGDG